MEALCAFYFITVFAPSHHEYSNINYYFSPFEEQYNWEDKNTFFPSLKI